MTSDLLIVGAGPAGLAAAIQAARYDLCVHLISREAPGGLLRAARRLNNYPGFPEGIRGPELADRIFQQVVSKGIAIEPGEVTTVERTQTGFFYRLRTAAGMSEGSARCVLLATGTVPAPLPFPISNDLRPPVHRDIRDLPNQLIGERVVVIGGGEASLDTALSVRDRGANVKILVRKQNMQAPGRLLQEARNAGVAIIPGSQVTDVRRDAGRIRLTVTDMKNDFSLSADRLFVCIGRQPDDRLYRHLTGESSPPTTQTAFQGLFLAGDLLRGFHRFAASAAGEGQLAACLVRDYLASPEGQ